MTTPATHPHHPAESHDAPWWRHAVIYQVYPRSWADGNGDGIGDLPGITSRLPYLADLGVDAVWLSPFYVSPMNDAGYDVADYRDIDPLFGTLDDADALIAQAHELGIRVIVDLVPNHTSSQHEWFQAALATAPGSPERDRYMFAEGKGADGSQPPNNWQSVFGGPAWTRLEGADGTPGQWYLHLFDSTQPDLNWENPQVREMFTDVLAFWLDRGVDGFRVDVAHGLIKADGLPDWHERTGMLGSHEEEHRTEGAQPARAPMWDQDGVHEIYREWRQVLEGYNPEGDPAKDRILVAEAWVEPVERAVAYVRPDEMHQAFNFGFLECAWRAEDLHQVVTDSLDAADLVGAPSTWVLSNHDVVRHASRLGLEVGVTRPNGIGVGDVQPNNALGMRRARAATVLMLALPGSAYIYQGEELGLPDHTALPDEVRQDPTWERSGHTERGRDGCRVPMPWEAGQPTYGFGPGHQSWLPQPEIYGPLAVDRQQGVAGSSLELYRTLLATRRELDLGVGELVWDDGFGPDVVAFRTTDQAGVGVHVIANLGAEPVALPTGAEVVLSSAALVGGELPTDTTVWLRVG
ncbi:glycoside hydrolase family 13 protein [Ornithinimicrobium cryptoxanthini]|uniref:Glycoside hydrolase family 13 protein n=1 Tax=Ornithinimicrobium cryptoxanthini TaxID=2934161 RepID=A0ABY4YFC4_9MICO|nr:glycoside hydrolase family 13 protein [Ornithinimicrobium cryptoxanthini]USQ75472.1 glycoside hydrolase family 13 protein [Ornithinimicrobium cryptoxanthini]